MKHAILGKGNLGSDISFFLNDPSNPKKKQKYEFFTRSNGFDWPAPLDRLMTYAPDVVWVSLGHGSVAEAKEDFVGAINCHVQLPNFLMELMPSTTKLIFFSTDYVACEDDPSNPKAQTQDPLSKYALSKLWMENLVKFKNRPNTCVVRVGSLYGGYKPGRTLPGKLRKAFKKPQTIRLPLNYITPTPTMYVASCLIKNLEKIFDDSNATFHHLAPKGNCQVREWGELILGEGYEVLSKKIDRERPSVSELGNTIEPPPHWLHLWESSRFHFDPKFF